MTASISRGPENTPIMAAEDGVVAYAGNELQGYGNLVLVHHPNGFVTAYAHAKELLVKRGDQVKRGQVIARSGQSGNVNAPQLAFRDPQGRIVARPNAISQRRMSQVMPPELRTLGAAQFGVGATWGLPGGGESSREAAPVTPRTGAALFSGPLAQ